MINNSIRWAFALCLIIATINLHALNQEKYSFNIPAQKAQSALIKLALQRDLDVVFYSELTDKSFSKEVIGEYTLTDALDLLLKDSGLRAVVTNNRVIQIERVILQSVIQNQLPESKPHNNEATQEAKLENFEEVIVVVAQMVSPYNLGTTVSSTKTQRDFLETPQTVNAIPAELITDIGAQALSDVTLLTSSATYLERSSGVADEMRLRGFAYPSLKINGIGAHAYIAPVDVAFIDSIEIAKGPSSVLFGRMEPGGIINMMLKPSKDVDNRVSLRYASDDYSRAEIDISATTGDDSSIRAIGYSQHYGDKASLDQDDAEGVMVGFEHYLQNNSRLSAHYRYESQDVFQQFGSPVEGFDDSVEFIRDENGRFQVIIPKRSDLRSGLEVDRHSGYLAINDWLLGDWSADLHIQYDRYEATSFLDFPIVRNFVIDFNGQQVTQGQLSQALIENPNFIQALLNDVTTISVDADSIIYVPNQFDYDTEFMSSEFSMYQSEFFGTLEFEQLYGLNINHSSPDSLIWQTHDTRSSFLPKNTSDVFINTEDVNSEVTDTNAGIFGQWVFNWDDVTLFLGARLDHLEFQIDNQLFNNSRSFTESSFRIGSVYKITEQTSLYLNYSEAFSPQFDLVDIPNPDVDNLTEETVSAVTFPDPARAHQYEAGIKSNSLNGKLQTNCAIFDIHKRGIRSLIEEQQSRGIECDVSGSLGNGWHVMLGINHLDATITKSSEEELLFNRPRMAPEKSANLWLSKDISISESWSSRWGLGMRYIGERYLDSDNLEELPSYNVIDFSVSLNHSDNLTLSLLLNNALDKKYTEGVFDALPFWTNPGRERTFESRVEYRF